MKRKLLLSILAAVAALYLPQAAIGQVSSDSQVATDYDNTTAAQPEQPAYKYKVFAGWGYTSLNQVNLSRYGLQGVNVSVTRELGKYFGLMAEGADYFEPLIPNASIPNPGNPSVSSILAGPVFHAKLMGRTSGFLRVLLGGEHTGGETYTTPSVSFAGGFGGGLEYQLNNRLALSFSGDDIASSFYSAYVSTGSGTQACSTGSGCSAHMRRNSRAAFGLEYSF